MPPTNTTPLPPELDHPLLIQISLDWFFNRMTSGVHGFATVSKDYGFYIQGLDPEETFTHVFYPEETPHLAWIYPKHLWVESVRRNEILREQSENERQKRFSREAAACALAEKYKQRETEITRVLAILRVRFGQTSFVKNNSTKNLRISVILLLSGKGDAGACKLLGICEETIKSFLELPTPTEDEESLILSMIQEDIALMKAAIVI